MIYNIWKLLHILSVIIFLGNITFSIYWKIQADNSKERIKIVDAFKNIIKADRIFTMPSITALLIFGVGTAMQGGLSLIETPWIIWSIILLIISTYSFMGKVIPIQKKILILASSDNFDWNIYMKLSRSWSIWGTIAVVSPYIAVALMVLKPI